MVNQLGRTDLVTSQSATALPPLTGCHILGKISNPPYIFLIIKAKNVAHIFRSIKDLLGVPTLDFLAEKIFLRHYHLKFHRTQSKSSV